ncbi:MAG: nucleotide exchange factor GrpE [Saprospiraceae bacterium]|nr:nucleotide exchange factor GrpE [Saprospiraceae bacterium]
MGAKKKNEKEQPEVVQDTIDQQADVAVEEQTDASELSEMKDKYLRLFAEFDNYKKRTSRERLELLRNAAEDMVVDLLPVLDDFDRIRQNEDADEDSFREGVRLVYQKLRQILERKGLQEMDTDEVDFDPELHEAITRIPAPSEELSGKILDHIEKGYYLNDKIIRHAKVVIGQ